MLRWGILGCARINAALVPPLGVSDRNTLLAIASRSKARAEETARQFEIPKAYGSYQELLADPEVDVVYVPLPNGLHVEWTIRAIEAGKHVLCEKPLALTTSDVDRVAKVAKATGRVVAEAFMYRHHPQTQRVRDMVQQGVLGSPRLVKGAFSFNLARVADARFDPEQGGGSLWDVGCYPVGYARTVLGEEPLEAFAWQVTGPSGVDLTVAGQLRFPSGAMLQFDSSFDAVFRVQIEVVGSEASLLIRQPFKPGLRETLILSRGEKSKTVRMPGQELYLGEVEDMADAILQGRPSRVSLADTWGNTAALVALLESARQGRPVPVAQRR
jgi:xylose dehydrogenase (NAD/NADP)